MSRNDIVKTDGSINYNYLGDSIDGLSSQMADIAVQVGTYSSLVKNLGQSNEDWSPAIQQAFNALENTGGVISFPQGKTLQCYSPIRIKGNNKIVIKGNTCNLKLMGLTQTSDIPILFRTSLTDLGGSSKSYEYNAGTIIYDLNFDGEGYGIGFKFIVAGQLHFYNCSSTQNLEIGILLSGTNGVSFDKCFMEGNQKGIFCALISEDSGSKNYTSEGFGWNDGIHFNNCVIIAPAHGYGVYYSGSSSEGVLTFRDCLYFGGEDNDKAVVYARTFTQFIVDGGWSEFVNGGTVFAGISDTNSYEPNIFRVKNVQFTSYNGSMPYNFITSTAIIFEVSGCYFQGIPQNLCISSITGTLDENYRTLALVPTYLGGGGYLSFDKSNFSNKEPWIASYNGNSYYLAFGQEYPSGSYQYKMYTYEQIIKGMALLGRKTVQDFILTPYNATPTLFLTTTLTPASLYNTAGKGTACIYNNIFLQIPHNKWINDTYWGIRLYENNIERGNN